MMLLSSHRGKVAQEEATRPTREGSGPAPLTALSGCADTQSSRDRREHAVTIADMVPASLCHRLPALHTEIDLARDAAQGRLRDSRAAGQPPSCVARRIARTRAAVAATAACFGSRRARCRGSFLAGCAVALELGEFLSLLVHLHMAHARSKRQRQWMDGADARRDDERAVKITDVAPKKLHGQLHDALRHCHTLSTCTHSSLLSAVGRERWWFVCPD